ncbi:MAG: xanthine dehydrogenase family protein subunit M [Myxococcales bacterium]|nr:xanthine dehydrogenase family protein subunit M [Myxococcales bacterium]
MPVEIELAQSLSHALELLSSGDPEVRPLAGATDLMLRLEAGRLKAHRLVSIADLRELSWVRPEGDAIRFGAGTVVADLMRHPEFAAEYPSAVAAARQFASPQIRNRATVGGNVGNASPAADLVPPLIALGARLKLSSAKGERELPIEEAFLGFGKTTVRPEELITEVALPRRRACFQAFAKFGSRGANVIAVVNLAMCLEVDGERIASARVAYGSVAPKPLRARAVERFLAGQRLTEELAREVKEAVLSDISPIDDVRGSRRYKQRLAVNATEDALLRALRGAQA